MSPPPSSVLHGGPLKPAQAGRLRYEIDDDTAHSQHPGQRSTKGRAVERAWTRSHQSIRRVSRSAFMAISLVSAY